MTKRARILLMTAERYRMIAGTITDPEIAHRLIDYADELSTKAEQMDEDVDDRLPDTVDGA